MNIELWNRLVKLVLWSRSLTSSGCIAHGIIMDSYQRKQNSQFLQYIIYYTYFKVYHTLALAGNSEAINIVGRTNTQTTTRKRLPQKTLVGAVVPVRVGLDPRSASVGH